MFKFIIMLFLTLITLCSSSLFALEEDPVNVEAVPLTTDREKCFYYKRRYEEVVNELKERDTQVSKRVDFLNRELPRYKEQMDYYCSKVDK